MQLFPPCTTHPQGYSESKARSYGCWYARMGFHRSTGVRTRSGDILAHGQGTSESVYTKLVKASPHYSHRCSHRRLRFCRSTSMLGEEHILPDSRTQVRTISKHVVQHLKHRSSAPTSCFNPPLSSSLLPLCLFRKRLRGEKVDDMARVGMQQRAAREGEQSTLTRADMVLSWEARRGSSTALVGLGRGGEALAEAAEAMDLADQVGVCVRLRAISITSHRTIKWHEFS